MPITDFFVQPVTILTAGSTTNRYGDRVVDWDNATARTTTGWLDQSTSAEVLGERDARMVDAILYLPVTATVSATDRVEVDGDTYEVVGTPKTAWTPEGAHHLELHLSSVVG